MPHSHGTHARTEKALIITIVTNLGLVAIKWLAYAFTRSPSLFGEAAHASADALNPVILWFGRRAADAPAHDRHPLGHERRQFLWSFVAAFMMLLIGSGLTTLHAIETVRTGVLPIFSWIATGIIGVAFVTEAYSFAVSIRAVLPKNGSGRLRDTKNTVALALTAENGVDMLTSLSALAGISLYAVTGNVLWDAAFSFLIAIIIAISAIFLMKRNGSLLIGESAPVEVRRGIEIVIRSFPSVASVTEIIAVNNGPNSVHCTIAVQWNQHWFNEQWWKLPDARSFHEKRVYWLMDRVEKEAAVIKAAILAQIPEVSRVDITFSS